MREALVLTALTFLLAGPTLVPAASAHAAPNPLANSVHVLADEAEDGFYWYDGYDLYHLYAREAYLETADEAGVVFRFTLYGGHAPGGQADRMVIDLGATTASGAHNFSISTPDDEEWTGDLDIVVANVTEDDPPWTGVTARMQVFASYDQLGVQPGGSLENVWMASRADEDLRDRAPGGVYLPHSQGQAEVPTESHRLNDSIELTGPTGYLETDATVNNDTVELEVTSQLDNGQHIRVRLGNTTGWNATLNGSSQASLPGGETTTFRVDARPAPEAREPLEIDVVSDLGARETVYLGAQGPNLTTALQANSVDVDPEQPSPNESPGLGAFAAIGALAALAGMMNRRRIG